MSESPVHSIERVIPNRNKQFHSPPSSSQRQDFVKQSRLSRSVEVKLRDIINRSEKIVVGLAPDIRRISRIDKTSEMGWQQLKKDFNRDLSLNKMEWQQDKNYQEVKNYLKDINQDNQLPQYFRFCLLNTKESVNNANRANQEIKETRFLWYQIQRKLKAGQSVDMGKVRQQLEFILKKFQRIKQNQYLTPKKENDFSWKLNSVKHHTLKSDEEQEYEMLVQNLDWKKDVETKKQIQRKFSEFEKRIREQSKLDLIQKKNQLAQFTKGQEQIIKKQNKRIYKINPIFVDSLEEKEKLYSQKLSETIHKQQIHEEALNNVKKHIKLGWDEIRKRHLLNYRARTDPDY